MADVEKLLSEYIAEHRAGGAADPVEYLDRLEGTHREELATLIDAYLARSPGRPWDPAAFTGSASERLTESLARSLEGASGLWPTILPRLRDRAQVKRDDLVRRLAEALGVPDREQKVEGYYHEMEQGLLPSAGVSSKVLEALSGIVGASADFLRKAGEPLGTGRPGRDLRDGRCGARPRLTRQGGGARLGRGRRAVSRRRLTDPRQRSATADDRLGNDPRTTRSGDALSLRAARGRPRARRRIAAIPAR
jgi:hypothetical protein